jgi:hypothetical protein
MTVDWSRATDLQLREAMADDAIRDQVMAQLNAHDIAANERTYDMGKAALHYARHYRWPVFPLLPGDKRPATTHGFKDATLDLEQIRAWWARMPEANIGTPTGADGCGYDVIDVDRDPTWPDPAQGFRSWAQMLHQGCPPGCCDTTHCFGDGTLNIQARAVTPRGGRHYYVPAMGSRNASNLRPGIDIRGAGGYVALPPSFGADEGRRYTWVAYPPESSHV